MRVRLDMTKSPLSRIVASFLGTFGVKRRRCWRVSTPSGKVVMAAAAEKVLPPAVLTTTCSTRED
jgi:hypothetical protein